MGNDVPKPQVQQFELTSENLPQISDSTAEEIIKKYHLINRKTGPLLFLMNLRKMCDMSITWSLKSDMVEINRVLDHCEYQMMLKIPESYPFNAPVMRLTKISCLNKEYDYTDDQNCIIRMNTNHGIVVLYSLIDKWNPAITFADIIYEFETCLPNLKPLY